MTSRGFLSFFLVAIFARAPLARAAVERLSLFDAEKKAQLVSPQLKAAQEDLRGAEAEAGAQKATYFPKLSFDVTYKYLSQVPEISLGPVSLPFGDHNNYSIGPTLTYTLWDSGIRSHIYRSLEQLIEARKDDAAFAGRQVLFSTRVAYAQAQLSQESERLTLRSLEAAKIQGRDISQRYRAGAASRLDALNSQSDVSEYEVRLAQSQGDFGAATADLETWIGPLPNDEKTELDSLEESVGAIKKAGRKTIETPESTSSESFLADHPQILSQGRMVRSLNYSAESRSAGHWPVVTLQGRASLDYPNGPLLQQVQQDSFLVNFSWSLFEFGRVNDQTNEKRAEAAAAEYRRQQALTNLDGEWRKARSRLASLFSQREGAAKQVLQAEELAKLNYDTYKAGRLSFLEVQTANLRLLQSRIRKAQIDAQLLVQYYTLELLAGDRE